MPSQEGPSPENTDDLRLRNERLIADLAEMKAQLELISEMGSSEAARVRLAELKQRLDRLHTDEAKSLDHRLGRS